MAVKKKKYEAPPAQMKELAPGVYAFLQPAFMFQSNSGLIVGKKWATVVDSQTNKQQIESFITKIKAVTNKPVRFVINTHFDPDHTFTNHFFTDAGALAIATAATRNETMKLHPCHRIALPKMLPEPLMSFDGIKMTPQDITFEDTLRIYDGEHQIEVIDLGPAHTISDTVIYLPQEKVVFCGDLMLVGMEKVFGTKPGVMNTDKGSLNAIHVLQKLAGFDAEHFVPGHGDVILSREEVVAKALQNIEFLMLVREEARKWFNRGVTYREAAERFDYGKFKRWGNKDNLYTTIYGCCFRAWKEFKGELPLGAGSDMEETMAKMHRNPDGSYPDRIDLGYRRPWEDW